MALKIEAKNEIHDLRRSVYADGSRMFDGHVRLSWIKITNTDHAHRGCWSKV